MSDPGSFEGFGEDFVHPAVALGLAADFLDAECQVGPREAMDQLSGRGRQAEPFDDFVAHDRGCRGRAGQDPCLWKERQDSPDLQILGPEVVTPLADAVGLVDGHQGTVDLAEDRGEIRDGKTLRGDVNQLVAALGQTLQALAHGPRRKRRGQEGGGNVQSFESRDLVVHEGNQRRDDQGGALEEQCGNLIAQALPAAGGRHQENPTLIEEPLDGFALAGPVGAQPEAAEGGTEVNDPARSGTWPVFGCRDGSGMSEGMG